MAKGKPRHNPDKPQNNKPLVCPYYETYSWMPGIAYCEGGETNAAYICKGNPHNCIKTYLHRNASRKGEIKWQGQ